MRLEPGMRVLVTGGCGFIGRAVVARLLSRGCQVNVLDNLLTGLFDHDLMDHPNATMFRGSVLDPTAVEAAANNADLVIHMASVVGQMLAHAAPHAAYRVAVMGTSHVLGHAKCPVVSFSSSAVYGIEARGPVSESLLGLAPLAQDYDGGRNGYATGKLEAEYLVDKWAAETGRPAMNIRPFNVVGPGQVGHYGMVLPRFIGAALHGEPIEVYGDGLQTRSFSDIDTFADVLLRLIELDTWPSVVNVGTPTATRIGDLATKVLHAVSPSRTIGIISRPFDEVFPGGGRDVQERTPDTTLLESLIGPVAWPSIDEIVKKTVRSMQYGGG